MSEMANAGKFFLVCLIFLSTGFTSMGQVIAFEKFDDLIGTGLVGSGMNENGWAGPWTAVTENANGEVGNDTITNITLEVRTELPVAVLPSGQNKVERQLSGRVELSSDTIWMSFMSACRNSLGTTKASVGLVDRSYAPNESVRVEFGKTFGSNRIVSDGVSIYPRALDDQYVLGKLIVAAIVPIHLDSVKVYAWVDPDLETPLNFEDAIFPRMQTMRGIDAIRITVLGDAGDAFIVDDIYLGKDLGSVLPKDWITVDVEDLPQSSHEPFDYTTGQGLDGNAGGTGFTGEWQLLNAYDHMVVDEGIEVNEDFVTRSPLFCMDHIAGNTGSRYVRRLQVPVLDDGKTYWFGAVIHVSYTTGGNVAQYFLANADELGPSGPAGQYLQFGKSFQENRFAVGIPGNYRTIENVPAEGVYFVVSRIETTGNAQPERISLWVNPNTEIDEPLISDADLIMTQAINTGWNAVGIKVEGEPGISMKIDDLATGQSFREVVPEEMVTSVGKPWLIPEMRLFPNPGNGLVNVSAAHIYPVMEIEQIEVVDMTGKVIQRIGRIEHVPSEIQLIPADYPPGVYVIRILSNNGISNYHYFKL